MRRLTALVATAVLLAVGLTGCLDTPAKTDQIVAAGSTDTPDGYHWAFYRNLAYPCSISGYQTFAVGTKAGSSATATRPLFVKMRGGGFGYFDENGQNQPTTSTKIKSEQDLTTLLSFNTPGLMDLVKADPAGYRFLVVSMCSQDVYGGNDNTDPHNPHTTPDGKPRPTTGLIATKAAIQYTRDHFPTSKYVLNGTSAGSAGTFHVGWALQLQGIPPAAIIADSGVINQQWERDVVPQGVCGPDAETDSGEALLARIDPEVADPDNQPDKLVSRGALTVPIMHVWNHGDHNSCGETPMRCTLADGSVVTLGAADCRHEPLTQAIAAEGPGSRSANLGVCVEGSDNTQPCDLHVVTTRKNGVNSDPTAPADYNAAIMTWLRARMADA